MIIISTTSAEGLLELLWEKPMIKGVDGITIMDFDKDNVYELYIFSLDPSRSMITALNLSGDVIFDITVERYQVHLYPSEEIKIIEVADLDNDFNLDILAGSEVHSGAVNIHPLYWIEREIIRDKITTKLKWIFRGSGPITAISTVDVDDDNFKEVVISSTDFHVYAVEDDGTLNSKYNLGSSVWDIFLLNKKSLELVAGTFQGIVLIKNRSVQWSYPTDDRILRVIASDLNNDGSLEILGTSKFHLYALNSTGFAIWVYDITDSTTNLIVEDLEKDGNDDILFGSSNILYALSSNGTLKWKLSLESKITYLGVVDLDGDGHKDLLMGSGNKLYAYKLTTLYLKQHKAENNYIKALELHKIGDYQSAVLLLEEARGLYRELNDSDNVAGIDSLLEKYGLDAQLKEDIKQAHNYYNRSMQHYLKNDFVNASLYVKEARKIYLSLNYSYGIKDCDQLLYMIERKPKAIEYYNKSYGMYINSDFKSALEYAQNAKEIFLELNDTKGVRDTEAIIMLSGSKLENQTMETTVEIPLPELKYKKKLSPVHFLAGAIVVVLLVSIKKRLSK